MFLISPRVKKKIFKNSLIIRSIKVERPISHPLAAHFYKILPCESAKRCPIKLPDKIPTTPGKLLITRQEPRVQPLAMANPALARLLYGRQILNP